MEDGALQTADVQAGMVRYIENRSYAKHVYTTGADSQVACGDPDPQRCRVVALGQVLV